MNITETRLALRTRLLTLSVATTGSATLAATATGYTRAAGSFVTDGFLPGMEILPAGFTTNTPQVIKSVAALTITTRGAPAVEDAASSRSLTCGLPSIRGWDNQRVSLLADRWAMEEGFLFQPQQMHSIAGANGIVERRGLYVIRLYGVQGPGVAALSEVADSILALFTPETTMTAGSETVRVRGNPGPYLSDFLPEPPGWIALVITIPWWMLATNS